MKHTVIIIGANGGIGRAFLDKFNNDATVSKIYCFSRTAVSVQSDKIETILCDYNNPETLKQGVALLPSDLVVQKIIVTTGLLYNDVISPEKSLKALTLEAMQQIFLVNCFGVMLMAQHLIPFLDKNQKSIFAALSARVGSISDNTVGGWYSYRAAKAALNMMLKTLSIEMQRTNKNAIIVGLHPGTVDTNLSNPFKKNVSEGKLFTPAYSVDCLLNVLDTLSPQDTGKCFAYDGQEVLP
jgi:NAD(P)-dependent dehydrogenase (short-subunit alcohol dehydrogenase family)